MTLGVLGVAARKFSMFVTLAKPLQLTLLSVTLFGAYFAGGGSLDPLTLALLGIAAIGGIGGVTALNMVLDKDIDSVMNRTKRRPTVTGELSAVEATVYSIVAIVIGVIAAAYINRYVALAVLAGFYFDIIVYTEIAKRRTPLNILLGGVAGGMPALGGWAAARGVIDLGGLFLAGIVMAWIPMHILFIAYYYKNDYARAGIPMASVVLPVPAFVRLVKVSLAIMALLGWAFAVYEGYGFIAASVTTMLAALAAVKVSAFEANPARETARALFKFASPIMAAVFLSLPLDYWLAVKLAVL